MDTFRFILFCCSLALSAVAMCCCFASNPVWAMFAVVGIICAFLCVPAIYEK